MGAFLTFVVVFCSSGIFACLVFIIYQTRKLHKENQKRFSEFQITQRKKKTTHKQDIKR